MSDAPVISKRRTITFSKSMAAALAEGRKTQTRRLAMRVPGRTRYRNADGLPKPSIWTQAMPGDLLLCTVSPYVPPFARAELLERREEWLHEMTPDGAMAEGIMAVPGGFSASPTARHLFAPTPLGAFQLLWESLHGLGAWQRNPRVVVLTFRMLPEAQP